MEVHAGNFLSLYYINMKRPQRLSWDQIGETPINKSTAQSLRVGENPLNGSVLRLNII